MKPKANAVATAKKRAGGRAAAKATPPSSADGGTASVAPEAPAESVAPPIAVASADLVKTSQRVAIDRAFLDRAELRSGLTDNLRALRTDAAAVSDRVTAAFDGWNPSGLSEDDLIRRNLVPPDADPTDALDRVIDRGLTAVKTAPPRSRMTIRRSGRSGSLVEAVSDGPTDGTSTIKLGPLVSFIAERQEALLAFEATPAIAACRAELEATNVIAEIDATAVSGNGDGTTTNGDGVVDVADVDELVDRAVNRQMRSATAPEDRPVFAPIPTGERSDKTQAALLETFQLRPGASDVPSYHEFNTLQIAFEHVWTRIFDGEIESIGRELYKEYVGLKDFIGYDAPDMPISTLADLERLMAEIKELSTFAQDELPAGLGGAPGKAEPPKSDDDVEDAVRGGAAVATGGLSLLVEWAIKEISRAGQKPVLRWDDVNGGVLGRGDRITATIDHGVAPAGLVEFELLTDVNSHRKGVAFQTYVEQAAKFVNAVYIGNTAKDVISRNGTQYLWASSTFQSASLPIGVFEFDSQETPTYNLGRYVLSGLGERLRDRSRVTFYWKDN